MKKLNYHYEILSNAKLSEYAALMQSINFTEYGDSPENNEKLSKLDLIIESRLKLKSRTVGTKHKKHSNVPTMYTSQDAAEIFGIETVTDPDNEFNYKLENNRLYILNTQSYSKWILINRS